ncbi:hypothetical protein CYLTODRAFT_442171 [Cylindrobasidium torrendii FP15055 ss-10]|uniref:Uncharacterized protein n=1 Tax=Cylindrobasidium torrendii FP15055 ss-10 TaxID=1314674 RepID=A0A0D7BIV4_9AGAR|nr:hypothetical protein CYLTODRAFT_442171 [Cylindrobasidium torrendii FP15055 ss-10]
MLPAPSSQSGKFVLQPAYFTSTLYVNAISNDIDALEKTYESQYNGEKEKDKPFTIFKTVWCAMGWQWLHFKIFDARSREMFLRVTCRLFIERALKARWPLEAAVAIFGLYVFFKTQPAGSPRLYTITHLPIPIDQYRSIIALPCEFGAPWKGSMTSVLRLLVAEGAFYILPENAQAPITLPREVLVQETPETVAEQPKKKGRPSKADRAAKAQVAVSSLEQWLQKTGVPKTSEPDSELTHHLLLESPSQTAIQYGNWKKTLLESLQDNLHGKDALHAANEKIVTRLQQAERLAPESAGGPGLERVQRAFIEMSVNRGGLLSLSEGAGLGDASQPKRRDKLRG